MRRPRGWSSMRAERRTSSWIARIVAAAGLGDACVAPTTARRTSRAASDDHVDEPPLHDDHFPVEDAVAACRERLADTLVLQCERTQVLVVSVGRDQDPVLDLAVHLERDLDLVALQRRRIEGRPRLLEDGALAAEALVQLLAEVRHDRRRRAD